MRSPVCAMYWQKEAKNTKNRAAGKKPQFLGGAVFIASKNTEGEENSDLRAVCGRNLRLVSAINTLSVRCRLFDKQTEILMKKLNSI